MKKLRYALIGCGRVSPNHIKAAQDNCDKIEIVAVCDPDSECMKNVLSLIKDNSAVKCFSDYRKMLKEVKPDLCAIATPSGYHASVAMDCIESHCHLIVEKPIALSLKDANTMIKAAKEKGLVLCANHQNRFNLAIQQMRNALEQGRFGKLSHGSANILWSRDKEYFQQAPWRGTWELDGGTLMNQCIHGIDLLRWMMGNEVEELTAYTDRLFHDYIEAEDLGLAIVKFKNGTYGTIQGTSNVYEKNLEETLYLFGEKGTAKAGGEAVNIIEEWNFADKLDNGKEIVKTYSEKPGNVYGFGHTSLYSDVIDAILNKREPYVTGEDGKNALEMVLAIYKSAAEGKAVKFPLDENTSTMDFAGRFDK